MTGLAEDQGQPGRGSEGGGQTRVEAALSRFITAFNLTKAPPQNMNTSMT